MQSELNVDHVHKSMTKASQFNNLKTFFVDEIGIPQQIAQVLLKLHRCRTKAEALELMTIDQNGLYNHVFLPSKDSDRLCLICEGNQTVHNRYEFDISDLQDQFQQQFQQRENDFSSEQDQLKTVKLTTCQICYINYEDALIIKFNESVHNICQGCMQLYLEERIMNMNAGLISCPHCDMRMDANIIKTLVSQTLFQKYVLFLKNIQIQNNPNLIWCPNPKCSIVISIKKNKNKKIQCPKCQFKICLKCNHEAHGSKSCNSVFKSEIRSWQCNSLIQKCKKCNSVIQKVSGCNHMSCTICDYEWCWLCGGSYSKIHYNAFNPFGCPGLQDEHDRSKSFIYLKKIMLLILIIVSFPILLPIGLLIIGPALTIDFMYRKVNSENIIYRIFIVFISIIVGLVFNPIFWIGLIVMYFPALISKCRQYIRQRRIRGNKSSKKIQQRLLNSAINNESAMIYQQKIQT